MTVINTENFLQTDLIRDRITRGKILIVIALSVLTLISYWGITRNDFINYDDPAYITENHHLQGTIGGRELIWAFTTAHMCNWHPLTWISLMVDRVLFGMNAGGYHWTNVILHLLSGLILFIALVRMSSRIWSSGMVAALFLVHPLHVESVAWIAERKDVLSGLFWMLGLWGYVRYVERPGFVRYGWVALFFVLGLLSKPMVVTFPFVLMLLDWWPLGRITVRKQAPMLLIYEKVPLLLLSFISSIITFLIQKQGGAVAPLESLQFTKRMGNAVVSYSAYLMKMVWPINLSVFYPYHGPLPEWQFFLSLFLLIILTILAVFAARSRPYLAVGWFWYLGMLVPVIGLVQVGSQAMADRYTYLPLIGIFIMVIWGLSDVLNQYAVPRVIRGIAAGIVLIGLVAMTHTQVGYWQNSVILFSQAIRNTDRNFQAHYTLGLALVKNGELEGAMNHYRVAIRIRPSFAEAHNGLGHLLMIQKRYLEAGEQLEMAIRYKPKFAPAMKNLGDLRMRQGKVDEAILQYRKAFLYEKEDPELFNNYGVALFSRGQVDAARMYIGEALKIKQDYSEARDNLKKIQANQSGR